MRLLVNLKELLEIILNSKTMNKNLIINELKKIHIRYKKTNIRNNPEILAVDQLFKKYLEKYPDDIDMRIQYALALYISPLPNFENCIEHLNYILQIDQNNYYATVLLAYLQDTWFGGIEICIFEKLCNLHGCDFKKLSVIELLKAWYHICEKKMYEKCLIHSIELDSSYVQHYIELGKLYLELQKNKEGIELTRQGLSNIKAIYPDDEITFIDDLQIEKFIDHYIKGFYPNRSLYEQWQNRVANKAGG